MKTYSKKLIVMSALVAGFMNMGNVQAADTEEGGALYYDNRGYIQAIFNAPNPVGDTKAIFAKIVYVDNAKGPAIYSYPSSIAFQETDFNVEYVDTAYGPAIYSYPSNNPVKHRLELNAETQNPENKLVVPVALTDGNISNATVNP
ncbi:hypothetical protein MGMO_171c00130 [Methyloglobulus morosus KoM1]|uniref:Uncharacterized protein n=1 Tax=Methyloglobulus morosus KoM1 TaxID=1116472 RepID=V5DIE6_9GAMM|nr:hypothetical protein [Methyloglobulus morosus]ESS67171.1 hypothetical protein MGMO_171c00130 [Methyloglobulus morosus KoM1]